MTGLYPLEGELERRLPEVGIELRRRISRTELIQIAKNDDEVDGMLGSKMTRDLYRRLKQGEDCMDSSVESKIFRVFGGHLLSETQRQMEDYPDILFKRTGFKPPWRAVYEVHKDDKKFTEYVQLHYGADELFELSNGYKDGTTHVGDIGFIEENVEDRPWVEEGLKKGLKYVLNLDRHPWEPTFIAGVVVKFIQNSE